MQIEALCLSVGLSAAWNRAFAVFRTVDAGHVKSNNQKPYRCGPCHQQIALTAA
jgi:hypothetical protein